MVPRGRVPPRRARAVPGRAIPYGDTNGRSAGQHSCVAQLAEQPAVNRQVIGSSPIAGANPQVRGCEPATAAHPQGAREPPNKTRGTPTGSDLQTSAPGKWAGIERRWLTLIAVCGATFMLLVGVTTVQVALPTIQHRLGASFSDLQWVIDAYALAMATLILVWGSSADRFGRKHVFVFGLTVFTVASLLCGVATTSSMLIWSRALQG